MAPVDPSRAISQANNLSHAVVSTVTAALAQATAEQPILQPPSSTLSVPTTLTPMITFGVLAVFIGTTSLAIGFLQLKNDRRSSSDSTIVEGNDNAGVQVAKEATSNEVIEM